MMDYKKISAIIKKGKDYWKEIEKDTKHIDVEYMCIVHYSFLCDDERVYEESLIDFLLFLNKPKKKISWSKIGFINEFLGWDCEWQRDMESRIIDNKLYEKDYESNAPLFLTIAVEYLNKLYDDGIYHSKLFPFRILDIYNSLGNEFLECNEDSIDEKGRKRLEKYISLMEKYIEDKLPNDVYKYIYELRKNTIISIEEIEHKVQEFMESKVNIMCADNYNETSMDLSELKDRWNEIIESIKNVTIEGWDISPEELIEHRLINRLLGYLDDSECMTKQQKDIIAGIFNVYNIKELIYENEDEVRSILSLLNFSGDDGTKQIDMNILVNVDNKRYEQGDECICSKNYLDFFIGLSNTFIEAGSNKRNKQKIKTSINDIIIYTRSKLEPTIYEKFFLSSNISNVSGKTDKDDQETVDELIDELNSLIGLDKVKQEVNSLINLIKIRKMREKMNMKQVPMSMHLVFTGNPGTGKTTVARLLSQIYHKLEILSKGHLIEVDRSGLVAGYVGQTALKVSDVIKKSMGGILFIDEAYSLTLNREESDFGYEAVDTLLKAMEDNREDLIIIVAGYTEPMESFLESNPGLRSRFNKYIAFEDYSPTELISIFKLFCKKNDFVANNELIESLSKHFEGLYLTRDDTFSNGRLVRNIFEKIISNQANRLATNSNFSKEALRELIKDDLVGII